MPYFDKICQIAINPDKIAAQNALQRLLLFGNMTDAEIEKFQAETKDSPEINDPLFPRQCVCIDERQPRVGGFYTPASKLAAENNTEAVIFLIAHGASATHAAIAAAEAGHIDLVNLLINRYGAFPLPVARSYAVAGRKAEAEKLYQLFGLPRRDLLLRYASGGRKNEALVQQELKQWSDFAKLNTLKEIIELEFLAGDLATGNFELAKTAISRIKNYLLALQKDKTPVGVRKLKTAVQTVCSCIQTHAPRSGNLDYTTQVFHFYNQQSMGPKLDLETSTIAIQAFGNNGNISQAIDLFNQQQRRLFKELSTYFHNSDEDFAQRKSIRNDLFMLCNIIIAVLLKSGHWETIGKVRSPKDHELYKIFNRRVFHDTSSPPSDQMMSALTHARDFNYLLYEMRTLDQKQDPENQNILKRWGWNVFLHALTLAPEQFKLVAKLTKDVKQLPMETLAKGLMLQKVHYMPLAVQH